MATALESTDKAGSPLKTPLTSPPANGRFAAFSIAWALSSLVTSASFQEPKFAPLVALVALLLLIWPNSVPLFLSLSVLVAGRILWRLPEGPNHYILELLVCLAFLLGSAALAFRKNLSQSSIIAKAAPTARMLMLIVYFFAVLDKTNYDYLSPHGCGWELISAFFGGDAAAARFPLLWQIGVYGSLATEAFLLIGLSTRGLRRSALMVGACFHASLAVVPWEGIASFSSLTLALYVLFMPEGTDWNAWSILPRLADSKKRAAVISLGALAWAGATYMLSKMVAHATYPNLVHYGALTSEQNLASVMWSALIFIPMGVWLLRSLFRSMPSRAESKKPLPLWGPAWMSAILLLAVVNGLCPFIGLKTQTSFAMFSNLRTEEGKFNHLFLPPSMQIFDYQKEVIHVTRAPFAFTPSATGAVDIVPVEFRRRFARLKTGDEVDFVRGGRAAKVVKGQPSALDSDLQKPLSFWQAKLLRFRPIIEGPQPCRH